MTVTQPKLLGHVASSSNRNKEYEIRLGADGVVYCGCTAWKMHKWCKHLDQWHSGQGKMAQSALNVQSSPMVKINLNHESKTLLDYFDAVTKKQEKKGGKIDEVIQKGIIEGIWS